VITTDADLLLAILEQQKPLAVRSAERLARFIATDFDPSSDESWATANQLWRGAKLARDVWRSIAPGVYLVNGHKIRTNCDSAPIPGRTHEWSAFPDNYEPGDPVGNGRTEQAAIEDLIEQIEARS